MSTENELFSAESVTKLSPRLSWMARHDVRTKKRTDLNQAHAEPWEAWAGEYTYALTETLTGTKYYPSDSPLMAWGHTEDDAILRLAENNGWRLWNEEGDE